MKNISTFETNNLFEQERRNETNFNRSIGIANLVFLIIILLVLCLIVYLWRILMREIRNQYDKHRFYEQVARLVLFIKLFFIKNQH